MTASDLEQLFSRISGSRMSFDCCSSSICWHNSIIFNKKHTNDWYRSDIFVLHIILNDSTSTVWDMNFCAITDVQVDISKTKNKWHKTWCG